MQDTEAEVAEAQSRRAAVEGEVAGLQAALQDLTATNDALMVSN
jgi:hypothetical protein